MKTSFVFVNSHKRTFEPSTRSALKCPEGSDEKAGGSPLGWQSAAEAWGGLLLTPVLHRKAEWDSGRKKRR